MCLLEVGAFFCQCYNKEGGVLDGWPQAADGGVPLRSNVARYCRLYEMMIGLKGHFPRKIFFYSTSTRFPPMKIHSSQALTVDLS